MLDDDEYGFINLKGEWVISPRYANVEPFYEGVAKVIDEDGDIYFIDTKGEELFKLREDNFYWDEVSNMCNGLILALNDDEDWEYMDKDGDVVLSFDYEDYECYPFHGKYAIVYDEDKDAAGLIDKKGNFVIEPEFEEIGYLSAGIAYFEDDDSHGFIDKRGKKIIQTSYDTDFEFDYYSLTDPSLIAFEENGLYGFMDRHGKVKIEPEYDYVGEFSEGLCAFVEEGGDEWGYINNSGEVVISEEFEEALPFCNGLALVQDEDGYYGYINKKGEEVIDFDYAWATPFFREGFAIVSEDREEIGLIDKKGEYIVNPRFDFFYRNYGIYRSLVYKAYGKDYTSFDW